MIRTLRKDLYREISHSLGRYLSIVSITALGVAFFAGIKASSPDMKYSADAYFDKYNLQDIQVYSTLGLRKDDLAALENVPGVKAAQGQFSQDYLTRLDAQQMTVRLLSYNPDQSLNTPRLVEGRMPKNDQECLIQADTASGELLGSFQIGDEITLTSGTDAPIGEELKTSSFEVVGKAYSPNYLSYELGSSSVGSGSLDTFLYVLDSAIAADYWTEIDVAVEGAKEINSYTDEYFSVVSPVVDEIEDLATNRIAAFKQEQMGKVDEEEKKAQEKLDDGQKQIDEAKQKFDDARSELDANAQTIADGQAQIDQGAAQIASSQQQLNAQLGTLNASLAQLNAGIAKIEESGKQLPALQSQKQQLENALSTLSSLEQGKTALSQANAAVAGLQAQIAALPQDDPAREALSQQLDQALSAQVAAMAALQIPAGTDGDAALALADGNIQSLLSGIGGSKEAGQASLDSLNAGIAQIEEAAKTLPTLQSQKAQVQAGLQQVSVAQAQLNASQAELNAKQQELDSGKSQLTLGEQEYADGVKELEEQTKTFEDSKQEAEEKIADARAEVNDLEGEWIVLDRDSHYSYRDYESCADRMDGIASVFPVFFFLVAALVCMTTMTRMVEEQRTDIGTLKALGCTRGQIAAKYLLYAGSASILGSIIGCAVGMVVFPSVIYSAWNIVYSLEPIQYQFQPGLMLLASGSVTLVVLAAVLFSIGAALKEVPAQLMRPKAAKAGKRILLEKAHWFWSKLSFMHKITLRNLFRYKKRFFMTVIGIAGCSALLLAGFGLNDSISDIVPRQFGVIDHYNVQIASDGDGEKLANKLLKEDGVSEAVSMNVLPVTIRYDSKDVSASLNIVADAEEFSPFVSFYALNGQELHLEEGSVLLSNKASQKLGVSVGDEMTFKTSGDQEVQARVGGIFEQYTGHHIFVLQSTFDSWHIHEQPDANVLLITESEEAEFEHALGEVIMNQEDVTSVTFYTSLVTSFLNMISSIKMIVVVLVLSAAMLAFVVLYNLSNVNISERMREIATIKVLGFTEKEVNAYINRETLLLALIGALLGLGLGIYLHDMIMSLAEMDTISFGRSIYWTSYAAAAALTMVFALIVNWIMKFQLRKIQMVESLKAVE